MQKRKLVSVSLSISGELSYTNAYGKILIQLLSDSLKMYGRFGLCCLMTPSLRTFGVMYDHAFSKLANYQIRYQAKLKWAVSLVIAYGHFNLPQGFMWVSEMGPNVLVLKVRVLFRVLSTRTRVLSSNCHKYSY